MWPSVKVRLTALVWRFNTASHLHSQASSSLFLLSAISYCSTVYWYHTSSVPAQICQCDLSSSLISETSNTQHPSDVAPDLLPPPALPAAFSSVSLSPPKSCNVSALTSTFKAALLFFGLALHLSLYLLAYTDRAHLDNKSAGNLHHGHCSSQRVFMLFFYLIGGTGVVVTQIYTLLHCLFVTHPLCSGHFGN